MCWGKEWRIQSLLLQGMSMTDKWKVLVWNSFQFSSFQSLSHVWFFATPKLQHARPPCPSPTLEHAQTHVHWIGNAIQPSHPLLLLPSIFPSIRVFSNDSVLHIRWPHYWNFSFSISSSNEYSGLISFRIDWFDLPEDKGRLCMLFDIF